MWGEGKKQVVLKDTVNFSEKKSVDTSIIFLKVAAEWPLLENPQICQDVKDKLQHLILQIIVIIVNLALHPILALNANLSLLFT